LEPESLEKLQIKIAATYEYISVAAIFIYTCFIARLHYVRSYQLSYHAKTGRENLRPAWKFMQLFRVRLTALLIICSQVPGWPGLCFAS
jgi:hypothetical protein